MNLFSGAGTTVAPLRYRFCDNYLPASGYRTVAGHNIIGSSIKCHMQQHHASLVAASCSSCSSIMPLMKQYHTSKVQYHLCYVLFEK